MAPSCWNHWRTLATPLRRPSAVQNLPSTWTYRSVLIVTDRSLSSSNQGRRQRGGQWCPVPPFEIGAPHFTFDPRLLHTSNTVFYKFGPPSGFWPLFLVFDPPAAKSWRRACLEPEWSNDAMFGDGNPGSRV